MFFQDDKLNKPAHRFVMFVIKLSPSYQDPSHFESLLISTMNRRNKTLKCAGDRQTLQIAGKVAPTQAAWKQAANFYGIPRWLTWK